MPDDWCVGDLAVCVDAGVNPAIGRTPDLVLDRIYRVRGFGNLTGGLLLDGATAAYEQWGCGFRSVRFRKIQPPKHEACEPEFVTLVKRKVREDA
jgi:hypothetical protein